MIDLHTHSVFSDGELIPAELIRRAVYRGYEAIAITDHVDHTNIDLVVPRLVEAVKRLADHVPIEILAGAEITHVPSPLIPDIIKEARSLGAMIVLVHGETLVEPVQEGTNRAAIEGDVDILAHPGLITTEDLLFAKEKGVFLEITSRKGHSLSNGYVAREAQRFGVPIVINTDAHSPSDLIDRETAIKILLGSGIDETRINGVFLNSRQIVEKALRRHYAKAH